MAWGKAVFVGSERWNVRSDCCELAKEVHVWHFKQSEEAVVRFVEDQCWQPGAVKLVEMQAFVEVAEGMHA